MVPAFAQVVLQYIGGACFCTAVLFAIVLIFGLRTRRSRCCPSCRYDNPSHARFCAHCGTRLA